MQRKHPALNPKHPLKGVFPKTTLKGFFLLFYSGQA
jgi:hypothetical protein